MTVNPTRILLADDHALVRQGVRMILDSEPDLSVVAEAGNGVEAVEKGRSTEIDLVIMDVAMPLMTGLQAARELARRKPGLRILMLSMHDNEQYFFESLKAGATGYVLKSVADQDLVPPVEPPCAANRSSIPEQCGRWFGLTWTGSVGGTGYRAPNSPPASRRSSSSSPRDTPRRRSRPC